MAEFTPAQAALNAVLPKAPDGTFWRIARIPKNGGMVAEIGIIDISSGTNQMADKFATDSPDILTIVAAATKLKKKYLAEMANLDFTGDYSGTVV